MHSPIEIATNNTKMHVNLTGAWAETLTCDGRAIFYPKTSLADANDNLKTRGGMHVCLPNFGPGGESGLTQHGFGRTNLWSVTEKTKSSVALLLGGGGNGYENLTSTLVYSLKNNSLTATLSLKNTGSTTLRVAPGFHPYLSLDISDTIALINDKPYRLDSLSGTEYITTEKVTLATSKRPVHITQENLPTWAIWTDQLGPYVCVEPTFGGNRFLHPEQVDEKLQAGEIKSYSTAISW